MTPRRQRAGAALGLAIALGPVSSPAPAQTPPDDGPIVVGDERDWEVLHLYGIDAALEFEWRRNVDSVEPANGSKRTDREDRLRPILELRTDGFIGQPDLLEFDLGGRFWPEQRWISLDSTGQTDHINQTLWEWDVSGAFIKDSILPVTVYTRQNFSDVDRQFGGSLENRFRETGVRLSLRSSTLPTNVQIFRRDIEQRDLGTGQDFNIDQRTLRADGRFERAANQRLSWSIVHDDVDESGDLRVPQSFRRFEGKLQHALDFGEQEENTLRTNVRLFDEDGFRDFNQLRIAPRLRLRHSNDLQSWYDYTYQSDDRPQQEQRLHQFAANVQHQLFDSLTTIANAGWNRFEITTEDFDSDEIFGRVDLSYVKQAGPGRVQTGVDLGISRIDQSDRGTPIPVPDQIFVFSPADLIVIDQRNVVESSIFMTDVGGVIVYSEGIDYVAIGFPDRVEIRRIVGGNIAPGQAVRIDYVIGPEPGGTIDTTSFSVDFRYSFTESFLNGLSLYGTYTKQDETRSTITEDFPDNDFTDIRYGVEYDVWKIYLRAERQERDSSLSPFDALRLEARYVEPLGRGSNVVLSALYQEIDRAEGLETKTTTFSGQWNQRFNQDLRLSLVLQYQMNEDNLSVETDAFEQRLDVFWRIRQLDVYAQVRNSVRNSTSDDTSFQRFIVGFRREF